MSRYLSSIPGRFMIFVFAASFSLSPAFVGAAVQTQGRVLAREELPFEPIEIVNVIVKDSTVSFGTTLTEDNDWLQGLTLRIKNISGKPISYIGIQLCVNPPESGNLSKVTEFSAGSLPILNNGLLTPARTLVTPNNYMDIKFDDSAYKKYKTELQVSKVYIRVGKIFFTDDTLWSQGMLHRRDPNKLNRWNVVDSSRLRVEEFYKQKSSTRPQSKLLQGSVTSLQAVSYRPATKKPSLSRQCLECYQYGGIDMVPCEYCFDAIKTYEYVETSECGHWRAEEIYANCLQYEHTGGQYCYPYEITTRTQICF